MDLSLEENNINGETMTAGVRLSWYPGHLSDPRSQTLDELGV